MFEIVPTVLNGGRFLFQIQSPIKTSLLELYEKNKKTLVKVFKKYII